MKGRGQIVAFTLLYAAEGAPIGFIWWALPALLRSRDVPVERIDPMANFYATVTRNTSANSVFYGDQKMSRADALKSYTWNGAYAAKEETLKGSLAAGKLADITVLSRDIMTIPEDQIPSTTVTYTIVGGKVAYVR